MTTSFIIIVKIPATAKIMPILYIFWNSVFTMYVNVFENAQFKSNMLFIAIVVPVAKKSRPVMIVVLVSVALSCLFYYTPVLKNISTGLVIIICTIVAATVGAIFFPIYQGKKKPSSESDSKDIEDDKSDYTDKEGK